LKILIVVHAFPPRTEGGSEIYVESYARELVRQFGDDVLVVTREADARTREYNVRRDTRDGVRVVWINNTFRRKRSLEYSYRNPAIAAIAERVIDEFRPDVAHVHHLTCLSTLIVPALAARAIPVFFTLHDYWLMCHRGQLFDRDGHVCGGPAANCGRCIDALGPAPIRLVTRALFGPPPRAPRDAHMREIASRVTQFLSPSEDLRRRFITFGIPPERIVHAPLGFDRGAFDGPAKAGHHAPPARPLRMGFVGSLMVSKAPHLLMEAASGFAPGRVSIDLFGGYEPYHGDDSYRERLAPLLASDDVRNHGHVPHHDMPAAFASFDVLVVPSVWPENSPLVIHEAFLAGVPVIASRIGGIPEIASTSETDCCSSPAMSVICA
jgi:glycosyltransferase involved in cell wall biosynthesis